MASMAVFLRCRHRSLLQISASGSSSSPFHLFSLASSLCSSRRPFSLSHGASSASDEPSAPSIEASRNSPTPHASGPPLPSGNSRKINSMSMEEIEKILRDREQSSDLDRSMFDKMFASNSQLKSSSEGRIKLLRWTDEMDRVLLDAILRQLNMGNRATGRFKPSAIVEVVEEIRAKTNVDLVDSVKVHSRLQNLKRNFVEVYNAFKGLSGFRWNPTTMLIEADEEHWHDLIKSNPRAAQWRKKPIPHYDKLKEMWGEDRDSDKQTLSTKGIAQEGSSSSSQTEDELETAIEAHTDESEDFRKGESTPLKREKDDQQETAIEAHTDESEDFRRGESTFLRREKDDEQETAIEAHRDESGDFRKVESASLRRERDDAVVTMVSEIGKSLERVADVLAKSLHRVYSSEEIYAELERLEVDDGTKFRALEVLTKEEFLARVLFGIPVQERKAWLLRRLYA